MTRTRLVSAAALLTLLLGAVIWLGLRTRALNNEIARLQQELQSARAGKPAPPPAAEPPEPAGENAPPSHEHRPQRTHPEQTDEATIAGLRTQLQDSAAELTKVRARVSELESQLQESATERTRLTASEYENRARVADLTRTLDNNATERAAVEKRLRDLEADNTRLRQQTQTVGQKDAEVAKLLADLNDALRRQQVYARNLVSRYREVNEVFRLSPGADDPSRNNLPDLARVRTALSMADDDVRALKELDARLSAVQKQLTAAVAKR